MPVNDYFDLHKHKYLILNNIYKSQTKNMIVI